MIGIEKLPIQVNVQELKETIDKLKNIGPMVFQGSEFGYKSFGGWNLQSRTGNYEDGFQVGIEHCFRKGKFDYRLAKFLNYSHAFEHSNKTKACLRPYSKILDYLAAEGFYPRRARVTCLKAGGKSIVHRDAPSDTYMCRIHIPIITNQQCLHWMAEDLDEKGKYFHMPADGSVYILPVNCLHQIRNDSNQDRYHMIVDAYDTKHITEHFKYNGDINLLLNQAENYRKEIDKSELNLFWKIAYTIGRKIVVTRLKYEQKIIESSMKLDNTIVVSK